MMDRMNAVETRAAETARRVADNDNERAALTLETAAGMDEHGALMTEADMRGQRNDFVREMCGKRLKAAARKAAMATPALTLETAAGMAKGGKLLSLADWQALSDDARDKAKRMLATAKVKAWEEAHPEEAAAKKAAEAEAEAATAAKKGQRAHPWGEHQRQAGSRGPI